MLYLLRFSEIAVLRAAALCAGAGYWYGPKPPDKSGFLLAKKEPPSICCGGETVEKSAGPKVSEGKIV